ncbi:mCG1030408, partial [Mus musculus]
VCIITKTIPMHVSTVKIFIMFMREGPSYPTMYVWRSEGNLWESSYFFRHVGPGDQAQVVDGETEVPEQAVAYPNIPEAYKCRKSEPQPSCQAFSVKLLPPVTIQKLKRKLLPQRSALSPGES